MPTVRRVWNAPAETFYIESRASTAAAAHANVDKIDSPIKRADSTGASQLSRSPLTPLSLLSPPKLTHKLSGGGTDTFGNIEPRFTGGNASNSSSTGKFIPAHIQSTLQEPPVLKIKKVSSATSVSAPPATLSKFSSHANFETADRAFESETEEIKEEEEIVKVIKEEEVESEEESGRDLKQIVPLQLSASAKKEVLL